MVYSHSILDELIAVWQRDLSDMDRQIALYFDQSAWIILIAGKLGEGVNSVQSLKWGFMARMGAKFRIWIQRIQGNWSWAVI